MINQISGIKDIPNLQGKWEMKFTVDSANVKDYIGDLSEFEIFVTQNGEELVGSGEQTKYRDKTAKLKYKMIWNSAHIQDDQVVIMYTLYGSRETTGICRLAFDEEDDSHLIGTFNGAAADSKGSLDVKIK